MGRAVGCCDRMATQDIARGPGPPGWYESAVRLYLDARSYTVLRVLGRWTMRAILLVLFVIGWEILIDGTAFGVVTVLGDGVINDAIIPRASDTGVELWDMVGASFFWDAWTSTVFNVLLGFAIGTAVGLTLAVLIVLYPFSQPMISDSAVAFEAIPKVTIIPVLFAWFGFGGTSMIILATMITFFPVFLTALMGMTHVPEDDVKLMKSMRANRYQILYMMRLPHALPNIFGGLKIGVANAMIGAILAEFLFGNAGLGFLVDLYYNQLRVPREFAAMILVALTFVWMFGILELLQRRLVFWSKTAEEILAGN